MATRHGPNKAGSDQKGEGEGTPSQKLQPTKQVHTTLRGARLQHGMARLCRFSLPAPPHYVTAQAKRRPKANLTHSPLDVLDLRHRLLPQHLLLVEAVGAPVGPVHLGVQGLELLSDPKRLSKKGDQDQESENERGETCKVNYGTVNASRKRYSTSATHCCTVSVVVSTGSSLSTACTSTTACTLTNDA